METLNEKDELLVHQRKANRALGERVRELERRLGIEGEEEEDAG